MDDSYVRAQLGFVLEEQGRFGEGESPMIEGYRELEARALKIPGTNRVRVAAAGAHVVGRYTNEGKPTEASRGSSLNRRSPLGPNRGR